MDYNILLINISYSEFKVEVGDIISEIDGRVTHAMSPDMVAKVVKSTGGKRPISISVTKTHTKDSKVYGTIIIWTSKNTV